MSEPAKKEDRVYTYADYLRWPDDERWELIDGVTYNMSPAPNRRHQDIVGEIYRKIANFLEDKSCKVYVAPFDVRLSDYPQQEDDEIINVVQPDVSVFCDESDLDEHGAVGPPDIAVEILSPSTSVKDQREKLRLYERFGVQEYWIVDPVNRVMSVYRLDAVVDAGPAESVGTRRRGVKRYGRPEVYGPDDTFKSGVLEGFSLDLAAVFAV